MHRRRGYRQKIFPLGSLFQLLFGFLNCKNRFIYPKIQNRLCVLQFLKIWRIILALILTPTPLTEKIKEKKRAQRNIWLCWLRLIPCIFQWWWHEGKGQPPSIIFSIGSREISTNFMPTTTDFQKSQPINFLQTWTFVKCTQHTKIFRTLLIHVIVRAS